MHGIFFAFVRQLMCPLGLAANLDWQARLIKILAFKTTEVAGISELI